jgi:hypothetical protein
MSSYIVNRTSDSAATFTVTDGTIDNQSTSITLVGRGYTGWGEVFNENFVKLLENFAANTQPRNSITGQIWYDTSVSALKYFNGTAYQSVTSLPTIANGSNGYLYNVNGTLSWTATATGNIAVSGLSDIVINNVQDGQVLKYDSRTSKWTNKADDNVQSNSFAKIAVTGQDTVEADITADTLTLVGGNNVTIITNTDTDTITINANVAITQPNSFGTVAVSGQSNVAASGASSTLSLIKGTGINITTSSGSNAITIASTYVSPIVAMLRFSVTPYGTDSSTPVVIADMFNTGATVVRNSIGLYTITFTTPLPSVNYIVSVNLGYQAVPDTNRDNVTYFILNQTAASFKIYINDCHNESPTPADVQFLSAIVFYNY